MRFVQRNNVAQVRVITGKRFRAVECDAGKALHGTAVRVGLEERAHVELRAALRLRDVLAGVATPAVDLRFEQIGVDVVAAAAKSLPQNAEAAGHAAGTQVVVKVIAPLVVAVAFAAKTIVANPHGVAAAIVAARAALGLEAVWFGAKAIADAVVE